MMRTSFDRFVNQLEPRRLLHGAFEVAVNFAPVDAPRAQGMMIDYGSPYDWRRGGMRYGWTSEQGDSAVDVHATRVQRNDTFIRMSPEDSWQIDVENGEYDVYVVAGDITRPGERMALAVEGSLAVAGLTHARKPFLEGWASVNVTDGSLTIASAGEFGQDKINYAFIRSRHEAGEAPDARTISINAVAPNASEDGPVSGRMMIQRTGNTSQPLVVRLDVTGSATNGVDYGRIGNHVVFAAGQREIELPVHVVADADSSEGDETVVVSLNSAVLGAGYTLGNASATVHVADKLVTQPPPVEPPVVDPPIVEPPIVEPPVVDPPPVDPGANQPLGMLSWSSVASTPIPRVEGMSAVVNGKLYAFGGYVDTTWRPSDRVHVYDPAANNWSELNPMARRVSHAGVAVDGRYVFFAGGYEGLDGNRQNFASSELWRYDTVTDTWNNLNKPLPAKRGGGEMPIVNGVLYYVAGSGSKREDHNDVWALDLRNPGANWVAKASLPENRNHFGVSVIDGKIYVIGGQTGQEDWVEFKNDCWVYDPASNQWSSIAKIPSPLRSHQSAATFVHKGRIIMIGGETNGSVPGKPYSLASVLAYDPKTNKWSSLASLPSPRSTGYAGSIGDHIYYTGGYNGSYFGTQTWKGSFV